jgi:hypothetical protein
MPILFLLVLASRWHYRSGVVGLRALPAPPNILLILADDLGTTPVGVYGNSYYQTPNIDRLAREGLRFTDAYSACRCARRRARR